MVVPVLITNCQVSLYPNTGPVPAQMITIKRATAKVAGLPEAVAIQRAKFEKRHGDPFVDIVSLPLLNSSLDIFLIVTETWAEQNPYPHTKLGKILIGTKNPMSNFPPW